MQTVNSNFSPTGVDALPSIGLDESQALALLREQKSEGNPPGNDHVRSLDGLRFLAFLGVFLAHADDQIRITYLGIFGVNIFFVLSGFLIGGILLKQRESDRPPRDSLRIFYVRRVLRIFPLYYAALFLLWLLPQLHFGLFGTTGGMVWQVFYLTNIYRYFHGVVGPTAHFWSLAVEEQFYLIAPMALLFARIKHFQIGLVSLWILNGLMHAVVLLFIRNPQVYLLSNIQFGYLGIGIAAALIQQRHAFLGITRRMLYWMGVACIPICISLTGFWLGNQISEDAFRNIFEWPVAILTAALVLALWRRECKPIEILLSFAPIVFLGQISYGLYVFHYPILIGLSHLPNGVHLSPIVLNLTGLGATAFVSTISWYVLERPIYALKRFFPYSTPNGSNTRHE